ncbi:MAG: glycine zipper 2TM domain-containing protein [Desulfovibrionales bacterium]
MKKWIVCIVILTLALAGMAGCAPSREGKVYSRSQARVMHDVHYGTVLQVEPVTIEGTRSGFGTLGGALVGGVLGSLIGRGKGRTLSTVGGALGGAAAGAGGEEAVTSKDAIEIAVELDNGEIVSIVQEPDVVYRTGDRVRVLTAPDGSARVRQ